MALFRKQPTGPTVGSLAMSDGGWSVAEALSEGQPMIVRLRIDLDAAIDQPSWPFRIGIAIPLKQPESNGWPAPDEDAKLGDIEDMICSVAGFRAVLAIVITTSGMREFVLHAQSSDWIPEFHQELRSNVASHEVQMIADRDDSWAVYNSFWTD